MAQPGRNDPCPCGSGKKYKRCCMEKDKLQEQAAKNLTGIDRIRKLVHEMEWENELYRLQALHFLEYVDPAYGEENIEETVMLWQDYANATMPVFKKFAAFSAALDYLTALDSDEHQYVTQSEIAKRYGVSSATVSKRYNEFIDFMDLTIGMLNDTDDDEDDDFYDEEDDDRVLPPGMQPILRELKQLIGDHVFETQEETKAFVDDFMQRKLDGRPNPPPPGKRGAAIAAVPTGIAATAAPAKTRNAAVPSAHQFANPNRDKAQDILYNAFNEPSAAKRVNLAKKALKLYPDSADAYRILAEEARTIEEAASFYKQGLEAGARELGETFFEENEGFFWGLTETRPYVRVKYGYAEHCWKHGDEQEARQHLEELLRLDPGDHIGARYLLSAVYLYEDELELAEQLLTNYDEATAFFMYDRLMLEYKKKGVTAQLKMLYRSAVHTNPHVPAYLLEERELPDSDHLPDYYVDGDENEAIWYVSSHAKVWMNLPQLAQWMSKQ